MESQIVKIQDDYFFLYFVENRDYAVVEYAIRFENVIRCDSRICSSLVSLMLLLSQSAPSAAQLLHQAAVLKTLS